MSLIDLQRAIAQIYTQSDLRHAFFSDPKTVGHQLNLNDTDIARLEALSKKQVEQFATSLKYKRLNEIRKLLPRLHACLGKQLTTYFWQYAESFCPQGVGKHHQDAYQFCRFLFNLPAVERADYPWLPELAQWEAMPLQPARPWMQWHFGQHDISSLDATLPSSGLDNTFESHPTLTIWWRWPGEQTLHKRSLVWPW